ncbi:hypothetical protein [Albibacterium indicum]|uniref:hypothetical protein n=1 Tax=Albibacterium indicum TaxID=2292082 RepID=UPI000E55743A|nr:hypothetical protein [Pedobacter indicus]
MKKITLLILALTVSGFAFSQERGRKRISSPEDQAKRSTEIMTKQLDLTAEQKEKVYALNLDRAKETQAKMAEQRDDLKKRTEKMREARKMHNEKVKSVLTAEQKEKWEEAQIKYSEQRRNRFKRGAGMRQKQDSTKRIQQDKR